MNRDSIQTLRVRIRNLDKKFKLWMEEAEKRNGQRFDAQQDAVGTAMSAAEKAVAAAMAAAEKAVTKAELAAERRFESVNEFRKTLSDQTATFLTRGEYFAQHQAVIDKIEAVNVKTMTNEKKIDGVFERGAGKNDTWMVLVTIVSLVIAFAAVGVHFIR